MNFNLQQIAARLESLEETIIFRLIDRAQLGRNNVVYKPGAFPLANKSTSLLDYMMRFHEETHSILGRYTVAEERPFFSNLPKPSNLAKESNDSGLMLSDYNKINLTSQIRDSYFNLLDKCCDLDDKEYGTTAETDIAALQAIARRIHFGSFYVAESKFLSNPQGYGELIKSKDSDALMTLLTRQEVEDRIIERIKKKCESIQAISNPNIRKNIDSKLVADFYFKTIIPLTKVGEITYLLNRDI